MSEEMDEFKEYRNGWPLCPVCGEDEVYSRLWNDPDNKPTLEEFMAAELKCYRCNWKRPAQPMTSKPKTP